MDESHKIPWDWRPQRPKGMIQTGACDPGHGQGILRHDHILCITEIYIYTNIVLIVIYYQ